MYRKYALHIIDNFNRFLDLEKKDTVKDELNSTIHIIQITIPLQESQVSEIRRTIKRAVQINDGLNDLIFGHRRIINRPQMARSS